MAEPISTTVLLVKAALTAVTNPKIRKGIGWIIAAILSPIILAIALIFGILASTVNHNNNTLELCFNGGPIGDVAAEHRQNIESMRESFVLIDTTITALNIQTEDGNSLDITRVKAVFYALFFGENGIPTISINEFVGAFCTTEERTRIVITTDEDGNEISYEETYTVSIPITDMGIVYQNISNVIGRVATQDDMANATEIYYRAKYGVPAPTYGDDFNDFVNGLPTTDAPFVGVDGFVEPVASWRSSVTSEFGNRIHPITGKNDFHTGIDFGKPKSTPVYSVLDGTVMLVRYSTTGYGYHVMVDHGGNFVTLYAHNSKILVHEGQEVTAGQKIAEVGTTGSSTGNHLHFEIRIGGEKTNPRSYLP